MSVHVGNPTYMSGHVRSAQYEHSRGPGDPLRERLRESCSVPKTKWKPLEQMTPFARRVTRFMWQEHEPPLSVSDLAAMTGITGQAIWDWIRKDVIPTPKTLERLADGTNLALSELYALCGYEQLTQEALNELEEKIGRDRRLVPPVRDALSQKIAELRETYVCDGKDKGNGTGGVTATNGATCEAMMR